MKYRSDIDGLRAIAVLLVVAFHAFPSYVPGGFIGVDVFFVISGYLISTIIFSKLDAKTFSFVDFYSHRIRRIFPALSVVLLSCLCFGALVLFAGEFTQLGKHVAAGAAFISNFTLWMESGYFDSAAESKPLLHLWSLGIEEQFYILWPFILWASWKKNLNHLTLIICIIFVSFFLNIHGVYKDSVATFYMPYTRFWELLSGSLLAWLTLNRPALFMKAQERCSSAASLLFFHNTKKAPKAFLFDIMSFAGLFSILFVSWFINKQFSFPGYWALFPVFGSVLVIHAGPNTWLNRWVLSNRVLVWVGLISYPLYLIHWPLLTFARILNGSVPEAWVRALLVILSIFLSWATYIFIESPIRFGRYKRRAVPCLCAGMLFIAGAGGLVYLNHGFGDRAVAGLASNLEMKTSEVFYTQGCDLKNKENEELFAACQHDTRGKAKYVLLGDSKAQAFFPGVFETAKEGGYWLFIGGYGKYGAPQPLISEDPIFKDFQKLAKISVEEIAANESIKAVVWDVATRALFALGDGVVSGNLKTYDYHYMQRLPSNPFYNQVFLAMDEMVRRFGKAGKKVVFLVDNPALPNPEDCAFRQTPLSRLGLFSKKLNPDCFVSFSLFDKQRALYMKLLYALKEKNPTVVDIFDPTDIFCDESRDVCAPTKEGHALYAFTDHISPYAARLVGERLNAFMNRNYP